MKKTLTVKIEVENGSNDSQINMLINKLECVCGMILWGMTKDNDSGYRDDVQYKYQYTIIEE